RSSVDALCRASSECGSVMGTIQLPLRLSTATTPAVGDEEKVAEDTSPPSPAAGKRQAMMMEAVDFGSTNRIMKLREVNGSSSGRGNSAGSDGCGEVESVGECPTVEPSPETIMPGDAPSARDELNEAEYIAADGYGFDYVIVFKAERAGVMTAYATETVKRIVAAGFEVRVYFSCSREEVFCEMRATVERLMQFADQVNRKMLLDRFHLSEAATAGDPEANIAPIKINDDPNITYRSPYECIYARYDRRPDLQHLYYKGDGMSHPFR
ncbi:unnamed protein product, partial [Pylaiella littoralis]